MKEKWKMLQQLLCRFHFDSQFQFVFVSSQFCGLDVVVMFVAVAIYR